MIDIQKACKKLNEAILKKEPGFPDIVNLTMNQIYREGGELYWDRDIFIDCNGEDEVMRDLVRKSDKVFVYIDEKKIIQKPQKSSDGRENNPIKRLYKKEKCSYTSL